MRSKPPAYVDEPHLPEVEPMPAAYEEDENEEIGRPEGPLEERHVDPYAVEEEPEGRPSAASRVERGSGRSVEAGFMFPARSEPEPEDEWPGAVEMDVEEPAGIEIDVPAMAPERESEPEREAAPDSANASEVAEWGPSDEARSGPAPSLDEPRFGRRPGRTKRGR